MTILAVFIEPLYRFVLDTTVGASVVVFAVLIVQWLCGGWLTPRSRYMLWSVLLLRLVLPWMPANPLSAENLVVTVSSGVTEQLSNMAVAPGFAVGVVAPGLPIVPAQLSEIGPEAAPGFDWGTLIKTVWLAGCLLWGLHVFAACRRLPRSLEGLREVVDARALSVFERCKLDTGLGRRRVRLCEAEVVYPLVCGLWRPQLVLPRGVTGRLSDGELRHVFLHELAHLKRSDLVVGVGCAVLQALHWFNPLVWYGFRRMRQDREYACDALALSHMADEEAGRYGHTLIKLVQGGSAPSRLAGVAGIAENKSELERRIRMIAKHASSKYRLTVAGLVLLGICGFFLLTRATAQKVETMEFGTPWSALQSYKRVEQEFPYVIEVETYETSWSAFRPGDSIEILEVRGTAPSFQAGQRYYVKGRYTLASEDRAQLKWYCTNGEVDNGNIGLVERGEGEFERQITLLKPGMLHLNYYPEKGGEGFGSTYFRKLPVPAGSADAVVDLATSDAEFSLSPWGNGLGYRLIVSVRNDGNATNEPFDIWFYEGSLSAEPRTNGGGAIAPGETWYESTLPINLKEGENTFYVKIDPKNLVAESDETNNMAKLTVQAKKVVREVLEVVE